jgi:3-methyladenine DNA glycosylase/8-oxoguanine DNA glycosylase
VSDSKASELEVGAPRDFSLDALVASHGWYQLRPFRFDPANRALETVLRLPGDRAAEVRLVRSDKGGLLATTARPLAARDRAFAQARVARMLHLDAPLDAFHRLCRSDASLRWIARLGLGRLLRAQDLWEDALKTLLTTNCTWKQTVSMVGRLVEGAGAPAPSGARAFPSPERVIAAGIRFLQREVKVGYRAKAAIELAERARSGELDSFSVEDEEAARKQVKSWNGFGDYAANSLLALLGKRGRPVIDSWAIARASELHFGGRACKPADVVRIYERFGEWSGSVAWFDLNRDHYREWPPRWGVEPESPKTPNPRPKAPPSRRPSRAKPRARRAATSSRKRRSRKD